MTAATSLMPGLEEIVRGADPRRRSDAARRIADLFLQGAANFRAEHIDLFDGVLIGLVPHTEIAACADLAERLSLLGQRAARTGRPARARGRDRGRGSLVAPLACHRRAGADPAAARPEPGAV